MGAIGRLGEPRTAEGIAIIVVAGFGVAVNGITAALFTSGKSSDLNIRGAFLLMAADAVVSFGVAVAGALYLWTGWSWLDPVASLAIAVVIVVGSLRMLLQSVHLMFDGVPDGVDLHAVRAFLASQSGVDGVHHVHVWAMSTSEIALTAHLVMLKGHPGDAFLISVNKALHERFRIDHPTLQIEFGGVCDD